MKGFDGKLVGSVYPITREECQMVHDAAIRVLEQGGVRCDDERAASMFEDAGCTLENNRKLVKFPEKVVMDALHECPGSFTLHAITAGPGQTQDVHKLSSPVDVGLDVSHLEVGLFESELW